MVRLFPFRRRERRMLLLAAIAAVSGLAAADAATAGERGGQLIERLFAKIDADGSGAISSAEGEAAAVKMFEKRDADRNGILTDTEFASHKGGGRLSADQEQKVGAYKARRFAAADANGDGQVSAEEFFAAAQRRFAAADANGDGQVTRDEVQTRRDAL